MLRKLYPGGKAKAFNITYDDGVTQDVPFVAMLNRYGIKGTFNLNSQLMEQEFQWQHESGLWIRRLPSYVVTELYKGHEVASHSLSHPYMQGLSEDEIMYQLGHDKWQLSQLFGHEISGFALPFDYYSPLIADCARRLGFEYSRCSEERYSYAPPEDYYNWAAGSYHVNPRFYDFASGFFCTDEELALCQIVGHSYDLDTMNMWGLMEDLCWHVADCDDIACMTNIELVRYLKAMRGADIGENYIRNNSNLSLWFDFDGQVLEIKPGVEYYR